MSRYANGRNNDLDSRDKIDDHGDDGQSMGGFQPSVQNLAGWLSSLLSRRHVREASALRYRLSAKPDDVTDYDILKLILDVVLDPFSEGLNTRPVVEALKRKFRTFGNVVGAPTSTLMKIEGMNEAGALALKAVGIAAVHLLRQPLRNAPVFHTSNSLKDYLTARLLYERLGIFLALYLDAGNRLIVSEELPSSSVDGVSAYPREVVRRCLELDAAVIIIAHNTPNENPRRPTYRDIEMTENIVSAATVFNITVMDHIIVGRGESFSMRAHGLM